MARQQRPRRETGGRALARYVGTTSDEDKEELILDLLLRFILGEKENETGIDD